mmetsp:Transcript_60798/g.170386  ORF Transcript_60798/g.170386 Transcript_60798/m.170386 type:complete len:221 (+) Transcript_60798:104-766(+)
MAGERHAAQWRGRRARGPAGAGGGPEYKAHAHKLKCVPRRSGCSTAARAAQAIQQKTKCGSSRASPVHEAEHARLLRPRAGPPLPCRRDDGGARLAPPRVDPRQQRLRLRPLRAAAAGPVVDDRRPGAWPCARPEAHLLLLPLRGLGVGAEQRRHGGLFLRGEALVALRLPPAGCAVGSAACSKLKRTSSLADRPRLLRFRPSGPPSWGPPHVPHRHVRH